MAEPTRVAAIQHAITTDLDANLATALRLVDDAAAQGAQLVVLPEFGNHPSWYTSEEHAWSVAVDLDGPWIQGFAQKAAEHGIWVMCNATVRRSPGRITDTNVLLAPDGVIAATSDKQVLMGAERAHIAEALEESPIVATPFGPVGLYSCMDGVIFETPRTLALRGAHLLLNSLNSFALDEACLHIPVRAPENRVWIVAANKVGPLLPPEVTAMVSQQMGVAASWLEGAGESQIVAPDGTVVAQGPRTGEAVVIADIDVSLGADKRRPDGTDVFASRRPELYSAIAGEPRGLSRATGADEVPVAVVQSVDEVAAAVAAGALLVVLPQLTGTVEELQGVAGQALLVTSVQEADAHVGVVVSGAGVVHRQPQLHASAALPWVTELGDGLRPYEAPWGRLAVVVGDDAIYPETFRLAGIAEVEVVAAPLAVQEEWELRTGLVERAAENRLNLVAASVPTGAIIASQRDFTLWAPRERPFDGMINMPDVTLVATGHGVVHPATTTNRFVSRGTDVVDGRPWKLVSAITGETS